MKTVSHLLKSFLLKNRVQDIPKTIFQEKIKSHFGVSNSNHEIIVVFNLKGYSIDLNNKFINIYQFEASYIKEFLIGEELTNEYNQKFINYNKIIFHDDIFAITNILNDKESREDIFFYFDYEKNAMLNSLALREIDYENFESDYIQHLFFYNDISKESIKSSVIKYIFENNKQADEYFLKIIDKIFISWDNIYSESKCKFQLIAIFVQKILEKYEMEKSFEKCRATIRYIYSLHEELLDNLIIENYFENKLISKYSNYYLEIKENV